MKIGRSHKWYYDKGEWKETKVTPDLWQIGYAVTKRRAGRAPDGSGVPVGTEYHWYVVAHQNVLKLNANDYTTSLAGLKFKIAHRRADNGKWSATPRTQRKRMIEFLQGLIGELKQQKDKPVTAAAETRGHQRRTGWRGCGPWGSRSRRPRGRPSGFGPAGTGAGARLDRAAVPRGRAGMPPHTHRQAAVTSTVQ